MNTTSALSRLLCGAVVSAVLGWVCTQGAVAHAASAPRFVPPARQASTTLHAVTYLDREVARPRLLAPSLTPLNLCMDCDPGGSGGSGGGTCNPAVQLASAAIYDHGTSLGWVYLFENTCTGQVWAHTWDGVAFSSLSATLNYPGGGSLYSGSLWCPFSNCAIDSPAIAHVVGAQYQACGIINLSVSCTNWIIVNP